MRQRLSRAASLLRNLSVDALQEGAGGIVALQFHQVIARGDLDEEREIASRGDRQAHVWFRNAEELERFASDSEAVVLRSFDPFFEPHDEIDRLHVAR